MSEREQYENDTGKPEENDVRWNGKRYIPVDPFDPDSVNAADCWNWGLSSWIARAELAPQWRPIEEAPKDGSLFLTYSTQAEWMDGPQDCFGFAMWSEIWQSFATDRCNWKDVTHWKPLDTPEDA